MLEKRKANPGDQSLPRTEILRKRSDFDSLFAAGERTKSGFITVISREASGRRVGFAVSRRVGGAVRRNRVKRLLREAYRRTRSKMVADREFVVLADETSFARTSEEVERELTCALRRAGILCD